MWQNLRLRAKVNILLFLVIAVFLVISLFWQYRQQRDLLFSEAIDKAKIITAEATRTREYLSRQLKAGHIELNKDRYGMIPVVAANRVGQLVAEDLTYTIRHTSNRFRNPGNAPDSYEQVVLRRFEEEKNLKQFAEFTKIDGKSVFRYLQAAYVDESCLECHGDPQQSPLFLQQIYPPDKDTSYNYRVGAVIGAVSITIPMAPLEKQLAASFQGALLTTTGFFLGLVICLGLLLRKAVLTPLGNLAAAISTVRNTGHFTTNLPVTSQDEIGALVCAFNAMGQELTEKTSHLEESERRFRLLVETARDAIVAFLPAGQIFLFNRQAETLYGYSQKELMGEPFDTLYVHDQELFPGGLAASLKSAEQAWFRKVHLICGRRKDLSKFQAEMVITVVDTGDRPFYTATIRQLSPDIELSRQE